MSSAAYYKIQKFHVMICIQKRFNLKRVIYPCPFVLMLITYSAFLKSFFEQGGLSQKLLVNLINDSVSILLPKMKVILITQLVNWRSISSLSKISNCQQPSKCTFNQFWYNTEQLQWTNNKYGPQEHCQSMVVHFLYGCTFQFNLDLWR